LDRFYTEKKTLPVRYATNGLTAPAPEIRVMKLRQCLNILTTQFDLKLLDYNIFIAMFEIKLKK